MRGRMGPHGGHSPGRGRGIIQGTHHPIPTTPTMEATPMHQIQDQGVKFASRKGIWLANAGTCLMTCLFPTKGMLEQSFLHMLLIQVGIWTLVLLIQVGI
jgi:hypothetical protein